MANYGAGLIDPALAPEALAWSAFDDSTLVTLIRQHVTSAGGWDKVAAGMGMVRSASDCTQRWILLESGMTRKGAMRKGRTGRARESDHLPSMNDGEAAIMMMYSGLEDLRQQEADIAVGADGHDLAYDVGETPDPVPPPPSRKASGVGDGVKRPWSSLQDANLLAFVGENGPRNWGRAATYLGGGRSGASCCARWCRLVGTKSGDQTEAIDPSEMNSHEQAYEGIKKGKRSKYTKWSKEEDDELHTLVVEHGPKNWSLIASQMTTPRTDDSCCGRWTHYLSPHTIPDGEDPPAKANSNATAPRWTPAQDALLTKLKTEPNTMSWSKIGSAMDPVRSAGSCRARWVQHVSQQNIVPDDASIQQATVDFVPPAVVHNGMVDYEPQQAIASTSGTQPLFDDETFHASISMEGFHALIDPALMDNMILPQPSLGPLPLPTFEQQVFAEPIAVDKGKGKARSLDGTPGPDEVVVVDNHKIPTKPSWKTKKRPVPTKNWSEEEETKLLAIVKGREKHQWASIADELGSGRTAASASARWHKLTIVDAEPVVVEEEQPPVSVEDVLIAALKASEPPAKKPAGRPWTSSDDLELRANIKKFGKNNWKTVGAEMTNPRSQHAASSRWYENLSKKKVEATVLTEEQIAAGETVEVETTLSGKRRWTEVEDAELRQAVLTHGTTKWTVVGKSLTTGRSGSSCRLRYFNYLENNPVPEVQEEAQPVASTSTSAVDTFQQLVDIGVGDASEHNDMFTVPRSDVEGGSAVFDNLLALASSGEDLLGGKRGREEDIDVSARVDVRKRGKY